MKKAEVISQEFEDALANNTSIFELAEEMDLIVQEANNINFTSVSLPSAGIEPRVIATASVLPQDQISVPIQGNNGVYVIVVNTIQETPDTDSAPLRARMTTMLESRANFEAYEALRDAANIKDNRSTFF